MSSKSFFNKSSIEFKERNISWTKKENELYLVIVSRVQCASIRSDQICPITALFFFLLVLSITGTGMLNSSDMSVSISMFSSISVKSSFKAMLFQNTSPQWVLLFIIKRWPSLTLKMLFALNIFSRITIAAPVFFSYFLPHLSFFYLFSPLLCFTFLPCLLHIANYIFFQHELICP